MPLAVIEGGQIRYVHPDHLGTPQKMTDGTGALVWDAVYRPFGEAESITGTAQNPERFPGQVYDPETEFHYNYFRDYAPGLGRYIESDSIGLRGGLNTYAYVGGNPLVYIDPRGLDVWIGGEVTAGLHVILPGINGALGAMMNASTGEICTFIKVCGRIGFGILIGGGGRGAASAFAPGCGKDMGGISGGIGGDIIVPGGGGIGGAVEIGGGVGGGVNVGVEGGAGLSDGIDGCVTQVLACTNTPPECDNNNCEE